MNPELTYASAIKNTDALKAIGQTEIYLYGKDEYRPWGHVTKVEPAGSHRLDISTSFRFSAAEPLTGLEFFWTEDIEEREANGKGYYEIASDNCRNQGAGESPRVAGICRQAIP